MCGFTAGGSGTLSIEATTINAPRTQIMHDFDFMLAYAPIFNDNGFPGL